MVHAGKALIDPYIIFEKIKLGPGMRAADLGCGRTGHFIFSAAKVVGDTGMVYAVDVMKEILESLKGRIRSEGYDMIQPVWSNVELVGKTPIPSATLDICFLVNSLFLMRDKLGALTEATRLLKSGGLLVVVDWAKKLGPLGPAPEEQVTPEALQTLARRCNVQLVDSVSPGEYHYCLIFQKP